nr:MAG TPA: DNA primase,Single-stranded DNA-binding protein, DnaG, Single-strand DNA-Binding Protein.5A [Caudoviricetes sp.]
MLDIAELLKARKKEFISLREFITRIHLYQPHVSLKDIADFLYIEDSNGGLPEWVKKGVAGSIETTWVDDNHMESDTSLHSLLNVIHEFDEMPEVLPPALTSSTVTRIVPSEAPMDFDDDIPF